MTSESTVEVYETKVKLTTKAIQGTALALKGVHDIHRHDGLPTSMLCVGDGVPNNRFQKDLEYVAGLFIDEAGDTLDASTTGKTTDSGLGNTLDIITKDLAMTLGAALSET